MWKKKLIQLLLSMSPTLEKMYLGSGAWEQGAIQGKATSLALVQDKGTISTRYRQVKTTEKPVRDFTQSGILKVFYFAHNHATVTGITGITSNTSITSITSITGTCITSIADIVPVLLECSDA